jgi:endonuclease/exonuclease/phosphatase family metal-dependent hydrolase
MTGKRKTSRLKKLSLVFGLAACIGIGYLGFHYTSQTPAAEPLSVVSFNVQFLGNSRERDNQALAHLLKDHDVVVVQELVSPPYDGQFPDGRPYKPDEQAAAFFDAMKAHGFSYILSQEDTGTGDTINRNGSSTEWFVAFYKAQKLSPASDLRNGYLAQDRSNHPDYERVPYAFSFRSADQSTDFVLISVHLQPGGSSKERARRAHEFSSIFAWIDQNSESEKDFIILGDMNIEDCDELKAILPALYRSLNESCLATNTNINAPKPYDHVIYNVPHTLSDIDQEFNFKVIDLVKSMKPHWQKTDEAYPGEPYDHNRFRKYYSDHHPVQFKIKPGFDQD